MKWKTLQHIGILFPPAFETQGIKLKIKGEKVVLNLLQEEMIYQWAKKKDTPYVQDKVFQKNFVADFAKTLPSKFKKVSGLFSKNKSRYTSSATIKISFSLQVLTIKFTSSLL